MHTTLCLASWEVAATMRLDTIDVQAPCWVATHDSAVDTPAKDLGARFHCSPPSARAAPAVGTHPIAQPASEHRPSMTEALFRETQLL